MAHNPRFLPWNPYLNAGPHPDSTELYQRIADDLLHQGWSVVPDFIPRELLGQLHGECRDDWRRGEFRLAGIGRGESFEIKPEIRNDRVRWLAPVAEASAAQQDYLRRLEQLRLALNRNLQLGLFNFEGHMAVYPPGSFYTKHLDQFRGIGLRTVTAILYLNEAWQPSDGGQLRIYTDAEDGGVCQDILPLGGQLVVFLSAEFMHEVLPATRDRMSITGWFKRRGANTLV
jgi:SM-20-related protein